MDNIKVSNDPTLRKLPPQLPHLRKIEIYDLNKPVEKKNPNITPYHIHSFVELPKTLPNLSEFIIDNSNVNNFEDLTTEMPNLQEFRIRQCYIGNFIGITIKNQVFYIYDSTIDSFEGFNLPVPKKKGRLHLYLENCTIRSLGGVSRSTIQAIAIAILSMDYGKPSHPKFPEKIKLNLTPTGQNLLFESVNPEIDQNYNPKHNIGWPTNVNFYFDHRHEWHCTDEDNDPVELANAGKNEWIYGFGLTDRLFISEKLDKLYEYYRKTTLQLAQEYIADPKSLLVAQIERLIHEADYNIMKLLENNLSLNNFVLNKITEKFSFKTQKGLILK